jgi:hypothetical protein
MNWRRGLLLAGIHLGVAGSLLAWQESEYWHYLKSDQVGPSPARLELAAFQEEQAINFNPCADDGVWDSEMSPQGRISEVANLPVALLTGWHEPCRSPGFLDSMVRMRFHRTRGSEILILVILCALVAVEWLLVGGFPLIRPRRRWREPGAFITLCTLLGTALAAIPYLAHLSLIPAMVTACVWFWWFGLLIWTTFRAGRRLVARRSVTIV